MNVLSVDRLHCHYFVFLMYDSVHLFQCPFRSHSFCVVYQVVKSELSSNRKFCNMLKRHVRYSNLHGVAAIHSVPGTAIRATCSDTARRSNPSHRAVLVIACLRNPVRDGDMAKNAAECSA